MWNRYNSSRPFDHELRHEGLGIYMLSIRETEMLAGFAVETGEWLYKLRATLDEPAESD